MRENPDLDWTVGGPKSVEPVRYAQLLKSIWFRKDNVEKYRDVPNRYRAGDVVSIYGESTKVYVNGMVAKGDEITGTDYFKVPPGITEVQFCYSSFSSPPRPVSIRAIRLSSSA